MKWKDKQYWYFVTGEDMGTSMSLTPRTPKGMSEDEPNTKRICVAPTAAHCMSAVDVKYRCLDKGKIYVYRTRRQVKARVPYSVYDSHITQEHWLHTKTRFTLVDTLEMTNGVIWGDLKYGEEQQKRDLAAIKSWCRRRRPQLAVKQHANQLWKSTRRI